MLYKFSANASNFNINNSCYGHSFQSTYPSWEPNTQGKQFLVNLRTFRQQNLPGHGNRYALSPPRIWAGSPDVRSNGDRNMFISREMPYNTSGTGNYLGPVLPIDAHQNNSPCILDQYYTSRPHHVTSRDVPTDPFERTRHHSREYWMSSNITENEPGYEEYLGEYREDRAASHLGASISVPIFRETLFEDRHANDLPGSSRSHWWARGRPLGGQTQASFFEPPEFNRQTYNHYDRFSDRGSDDQEQHLDWRDYHRLSRTTHTDDLEAGEFNLHFDDVYSRPPETPTPTIKPSTANF